MLAHDTVHHEDGKRIEDEQREEGDQNHDRRHQYGVGQQLAAVKPRPLALCHESLLPEPSDSVVDLECHAPIPRPSRRLVRLAWAMCNHDTREIGRAHV